MLLIVVLVNFSQKIIRWSRLPARDPHYYRDIAIHLVVMGGFERNIVFSHGRISCERSADTEADFETTKEHTYSGGLYQTGRPFDQARPTVEGDGSTVEFLGWDITSVNATNNYRIVEIIVYDGVLNYKN